MARSVKRTLKIGRMRAKARKRLEAEAYLRHNFLPRSSPARLTTFAYNDIDRRYGKKQRSRRASGDITRPETVKRIPRQPNRRVRRGNRRTSLWGKILKLF